MLLCKPDGAGFTWGRASSDGNQGLEKHLNTGTREPGPRTPSLHHLPTQHSSRERALSHEHDLSCMVICLFFPPYISLLCPFFLLLMTVKVKCEHLAFGVT